ncbi:MAG: universal stress protein [Candidatus Latescibacteria bacterium]|nr:universal stress protein [Candidatus Latescibacterota bacterium]
MKKGVDIMLTMKKILFPTDFSSFAEHALPYAVALAEEFDAALYMLYVEEVLPYIPGDPERRFPDAQLAEEAIHAQMEESISQHDAGHVEVKRYVARGYPADEVVEFAKKEEVDVIVMSTHGRTGLKHLLLGSTTEKVVRKSPCPVLSIRHPEHEFVHP